MLRRVIFAALLAAPLLAGAAEAILHTPQGDLEGGAAKLKGVTLYAGIPYAAPPVGPLRWAPPRPAATWSGVRDAHHFGPHCPQPAVFSGIHFPDDAMSEDCLTLNVWTAGTTARKPVYFWIHGGGFVTGGGAEPRYDGSYFAAHGVVVVSVNYRLGLFGFFAHPDLAAEQNGHAGNYGLMDLVAALHWVQDNIGSYGGDPAQVTIGGESAGSSAVSLLMAAPDAQGLFQRAIGESGAGIAPPSTGMALRSLSDSLAAGSKMTENAGATLADWRALPTDAVLQAAKGQFAPNVDGAFLPEPASAVYKSGRQSRVPLLAGWNRDEGLWFARDFFKLDPSPEAFAARAKAAFGPAADRLLALYPANTEATALIATDELTSDQVIDYPTWRWLDFQQAVAPAYRYQFDRQPAVPYHYTGQSPAEWGVYHTGELEYVFHTLDKVDAPWQKADRQLSDHMAAAWLRFIKTGNPNGPGLPHWPVYDPASHHAVLHFNASLSVIPEAQRVLDRYGFFDATLASP
jgi:para-nitrobenzyl esterase